MSTYGRILPSDFIPSLKYFPPDINVKPLMYDSDLPDITGLHSENESYRSLFEGENKSS